MENYENHGNRRELSDVSRYGPGALETIDNYVISICTGISIAGVIVSGLALAAISGYMGGEDVGLAFLAGLGLFGVGEIGARIIESGQEVKK